MCDARLSNPCRSSIILPVDERLDAYEYVHLLLDALYRVHPHKCGMMIEMSPVVSYIAARFRCSTTLNSSDVEVLHEGLQLAILRHEVDAPMAWKHPVLPDLRGDDDGDQGVYVHKTARWPEVVVSPLLKEPTQKLLSRPAVVDEPLPDEPLLDYLLELLEALDTSYSLALAVLESYPETVDVERMSSVLLAECDANEFAIVCESIQYLVALHEDDVNLQRFHCDINSIISSDSFQSALRV